MAEPNKKSLSYKLQKNPILLVFGIIAIAVALFVIVNVTSAIKEKIDSKAETESQVITTVEETEPETEAVAQLKDVKLYNSNIVSYTVEADELSVSLMVEYADKSSLLSVHKANDLNSSDYIPVFCFYNDEGVRFNCPAELNLDAKNNTAAYKLSEINDFANAIALTDEITVTYGNILDLPFELCLQSKSTGDIGAAIIGTYEREKGSSTENYSVNLISPAEGIKKAELAKTDEFVWLDIYYDDFNSYTQLNNNFTTNFVRFGVNYNGASYTGDFIVTEYDSLNMVRCKFDSYSMEGLAKEMGNSSLTVADIFGDCYVSVWTSDYDVETSLFSINGVASVPVADDVQ